MVIHPQPGQGQALMKVLVTGASGFIGRRLTERLVANGHDVHAVVHMDDSIGASGQSSGTLTKQYYDGGTASIVSILDTVRPDVVYHLAVHFVAEHASGDISRLVESNIAFGTQLLEAMSLSGVTNLVNAGTSWQHGDESADRPSALYAATKQAFESLVKYYVDRAGLHAVTLKLFDTYGPDDPRQKIVPLLLRLGEDMTPLDMSPGEQHLNLVYIDDVVNAFIHAGELLVSREISGYKDFAVRSDSTVSLKELVVRFETLCDKKLLINWGGRPYRAREIMTPWKGDVLPGWQAEVSLEDGLRRTIESYEADRGKLSSQQQVNLSFVIPCFNEADSIPILCQRMVDSISSHNYIKYDIIIVENGSTDGSAEIIRDLHKNNPRIKMVRLSRNFGYQGAITAGLQHASGEWVAVLDGDLQDPPELIVNFLEKALEGFDVVYGVKTKRKGSRFKNFLYKTFYYCFSFLAEIEMPKHAGEFCVMHRRVVDIINDMPERQRFIRGLRTWTGFRQTGYSYTREERAHGKSKFSLSGMFGLGIDGILSFSSFPLRITILFGFITVMVSMLLGVVQGIMKALKWLDIMDITTLLPPGLTQTNLVMSFLFGVTITCLGVVGEYVGRIYNEVKQRPTFIVSEKLF